MEFVSITPEEAHSLKYSNRNGTRGEHQPILDALEKGPVRIPVPADSKLDSVKWAITRAAKKAGVKICVRTVEDKSAVVVTKMQDTTAPPETSKPPAAASAKK